MNIKEKIKSMLKEKRGSGGINANPELSAEVTIIVRGADGKIKSEHKAVRTKITL